MPKLDDIAALRIELAQNRFEARLAIMIAGRELKQETPHAFAEQVGDDPEILDQRFSASEFLDVRYELADFHRVGELSARSLPLPGFDVSDGWPRVEGRVDFDGIELRRVMVEPFPGRHPVRIK